MGSALAGAVAEAAWFEELDASVEDAVYDPAFMSETDWRLAECAPGDPTRAMLLSLDTLAGLLGSGGLLWPALVQQASALLAPWRPFFQLPDDAA
jgi:hypothetical protein